jgi:hypothetical protein
LVGLLNKIKQNRYNIRKQKTLSNIMAELRKQNEEPEGLTS